ncbi:MAG: amino acid ABC transporter substrate-binding protein [Actinobacteria bacterium]|nr:amino acid ABC transporter substrate-binding protein [Actinomycetota bacterium]
MHARRTASLIVAAVLAAGLALSACSSTGSTGGSGSPSNSASNSASVGGSSSASVGSSSTSPSSESPSESTSGGSSSESISNGPSTGTTACSPADLKTKKPGTLTIATDQPVYEPWFVDNDPANGKGFEGAVAYAVAQQLGYSKDQVTWMRASFDSVISPAPKEFDFDINEFSITSQRAKVVDFSSGYYDVAQAVVTTKGSKIAGAKSLADLKNATLGAQIGTTSLNAINNIIKPSVKPAVFTTNDDAVKALQNGQIDGVVTDLPTAFYMSGAQLDNGVIVGQLPADTGQPEQFGLLIEKGSPITSCVSGAVDALRADGTLAKLAEQWLAQAGAPELK